VSRELGKNTEAAGEFGDAVLEMGVDLGSLVQRRKVSFEELSGKTNAVDAYNALYSFSQ